jgi:hypothetical protein
LNLEPYDTLISGVLVPAGIVLGAKRTFFSNLHLNIAVCSILPLVAMSFLMLDHESLMRRYLSMIGFCIAYFGLSYAGARVFDKYPDSR